jgi:hypothetical protein
VCMSQESNATVCQESQWGGGGGCVRFQPMWPKQQAKGLELKSIKYLLGLSSKYLDKAKNAPYIYTAYILNIDTCKLS